jgi:hypothetical protein
MFVMVQYVPTLPFPLNSSQLFTCPPNNEIVMNKLTMEDVHIWMTEIEKYEPSLMHPKSPVPTATAATIALPRASTPPGDGTKAAAAAAGAPGHVRKKTLLSSMSAPSQKNKRLPSGATKRHNNNNDTTSTTPPNHDSPGPSSPDPRQSLAVVSAPDRGASHAVGTFLSPTGADDVPHMTIGGLMHQSNATSILSPATALALASTTTTLVTSVTSSIPVTTTAPAIAVQVPTPPIPNDGKRTSNERTDGIVSPALGASIGVGAITSGRGSGRESHDGDRMGDIAKILIGNATYDDDINNGPSTINGIIVDTNITSPNNATSVATTAATTTAPAGGASNIGMAKRQVTTLAGHEFAHRYGMSFYQTSCNSGNGVDNAFSALRKLICGYLSRSVLLTTHYSTLLPALPD